MIVTVVISRTNHAFVYGPFPTKAHAEAWAMENLKGHTWQHSSVSTEDSDLMLKKWEA